FENKLNNGKYQFYYNCLTALAALYYKMADFERAEVLFYKAKSINEQYVGNPSNNALNLYNIGLIYKKIANYANAETVLLESLSISEKLFGREHPRCAQILNALGGLYYEMNDYVKSSAFYLESININAKTLGKETEEYA